MAKTKKTTTKKSNATEEKKRPTAKGKSGVIASPVMRCSFPFVHKADVGGEYSKGDYNITCFIPKEREAELKSIKQACMAAAKQDWPDIKFNQLEHPFRDGDEDGGNAYAGSIFFKSKTKRKPQIVGPDLQPLAEGEEVYGGCYVRVSVVAASYYRPGEVLVEKPDGSQQKKKKQIRGVTLYLNNVQFVKDGERMGGGSNPSEDFEEIDPSEFDEMEEGEDFEDDADEELEDEIEEDDEI